MKETRSHENLWLVQEFLDYLNHIRCLAKQPWNYPKTEQFRETCDSYAGSKHFLYSLSLIGLTAELLDISFGSVDALLMALWIAAFAFVFHGALQLFRQQALDRKISVGVFFDFYNGNVVLAAVFGLPVIMLSVLLFGNSGLTASVVAVVVALQIVTMTVYSYRWMYIAHSATFLDIFWAKMSAFAVLNAVQLTLFG